MRFHTPTKIVFIFLLLFIAVAVVAAIRFGRIQVQTPPSMSLNINLSNSMKISSPTFAENQLIPPKFTCDGQNINPSLEFKDVPKEAKSLVLIMDDPDVPKNLKPDGVFDHWVVFNMSPTTTSIAENQTPPGVPGNNGAGKPGYAGPCPPDREHRYFFRLYALDVLLDLSAGASKQKVLEAINGHVLAQAELMGRYSRGK